MALYIKDRLYLQITINGVELPLDKLSIVKYLHISESVRSYLPTLSFHYIDATQFLTVNTLLTDGAQIRVSVGQDTLKRVFTFRKFNHKEIPSNGGKEYQISAYLDSPQYWAASTFKAFSGTATDMLQQIAGACNLGFMGVGTTDSQVWMPYNTKYCEYARQVSEHAWVNDQSCIQLVVTGDKVMRMVNVSDLDSRKPKELFSSKGDNIDSYPVTDFDVVARSGFYNASSGYQDTLVVQSLLVSDNQNLSQVSIRRNSQKVSISRDIKGLITQSKVRFAPIDVGNVAPNYDKALYQNRRLSNLFNFGIEFNVPRIIDSNVLDTVSCELTKTGLTGVQEISGVFTIASKALYLRGMDIVQKVEVFRHGMNSVSDVSEF